MNSRPKVQKIRILHLSDGVSESSQCLKIHQQIDDEIFVSTIATVRKSELPNVNGLNYRNRMLYTISNRISSFVAVLFGIERQIGWSLINLKKCVSTFKPDIVHIHVANSGFINWNKLDKLEVPVVISLHDLWPVLITRSFPEHHPELNHHQNRLKKLLLTNLKSKKMRVLSSKNVHLVSPSLAMSEKLGELTPNLQALYTIIPNFTELSSDRYSQSITKKQARKSLGLASDDRIIGGVVAHRLTPEKRIEIVNDLKAKCQDLHIISCGKKDTGLNIDIEFGTLNRHEMERFIMACDFIFIPSKFESFSQVAAESALLGRPIIYMPMTVCGFEDFTQEGQGRFIVPDMNSDKLKISISQAMRVDPQAISKYAYSTLDPNLTRQKWKIFYAKLMEQREP